MDEELAREVTRSTLAGIDQALQSHVHQTAIRIGADGATATRFKQAVAMPRPVSDSLCQISPAVCRKLKVSSASYAMGAGFAGMLPWLLVVSSTLAELKKLAAKAPAAPPAP